MSGSHMTYCLQIDKSQNCVFLQFHGLLPIFPALMIIKTSLVVFIIETAVMRCVMWLFKARAV